MDGSADSDRTRQRALLEPSRYFQGRLRRSIGDPQIRTDRADDQRARMHPEPQCQGHPQGLL